MKIPPVKQRHVAFFPSIKFMSSNPYWTVLISALEKSGVVFHYNTPSVFNLKWLLDNRTQINVLHLHYCQQFYTVRKGKTRLSSIMRFAFILLLARILGFRTIFTLHNLEPTYPLEPAWADYLGHWVAGNLTNRVIVHCAIARQLLAQRYGRRHDVFIVDHPNCTDWHPNNVSKESAREALALSDNLFVFTFLGGVRPNKGLETLIKAFLNLKDKKFCLMIAGKTFPPESYVQSLKEMAKMDERIIFHLKHIPDDEIQLYMNAADVVVLPFTRILTSSSANLAMSFHRPVILPRMGCLPELIGSGGGWLFEPNDLDSLTAAMKAASISDTDQVGRNAFNKVLSHTSEHFAEQTMLAYWAQDSCKRI
jgi:beta-1,4-mannosyltransferase